MSLASQITALATRVAQELKAARSRELLVQRVAATIDPDSASVKTVTLTLPVPLEANRGWMATVTSDVGSAGMIVFRIGKQHTGTVTTVAVSFLSLTGNFPPTDIHLYVTGYPAA